jgi:hypothetical protein
MKSEYCKYSSCIKEGLSEYLKCSKLSNYCKYQRYCTTKKRVVHTDDVEKCSILRAEEESKMANKKQNRKEKKVDDSALKIEVEKVTEKGIVVLATPNYYIASINGSNVKITSKNNYKKGDIVKI